MRRRVAKITPKGYRVVRPSNDIHPASRSSSYPVSTIVPAMTELFSGIPETDAAGAADLMAAGALMVDIREADEWEEVRIPGAIFKPLSEINGWFEELPRDRTVILQCRSGNRSAMAAAALMREADMNNVVNLTGGIIAWHQAGLPIDLDPLPH